MQYMLRTLQMRLPHTPCRSTHGMQVTPWQGVLFICENLQHGISSTAHLTGLTQTIHVCSCCWGTKLRSIRRQWSTSMRAPWTA